MNAAGVSKGIPSDDGLVGLNGHVHQTRHHSRHGIDALRVDVGIDIQMLVTTQYHGNLFERCVSGTFTNTVHRHLHLTRTIEHTLEGVGRSHAQVVVAMGGDDGLVNAVNMVDKILDLCAILLRKTIARGVGDVDYRCASFDDSLYHTCQILVVGAAGVFSIEFHILYEPLGILHRLNGTLNDFLTIAIELVFDVQVASSNARVDALVLGILQRLNGNVDVFLDRPCECTNGWPRDGL